jgi:hypothetical protein
MVNLSYELKIDTAGRMRRVRIHRGLFIVGHGCLVVVKDDREAVEILNKAEGDNEACIFSP